MTLPDAADIPPASHGGKRIPGPGKKIGPKFKEGPKSYTMSITLSSEKAAKKLRAKAKAAGVTPGALVEKVMKLREAK